MRDFPATSRCASTFASNVCVWPQPQTLGHEPFRRGLVKAYFAIVWGIEISQSPGFQRELEKLHEASMNFGPYR